MKTDLDFTVDRAARVRLSVQIHAAIGDAIRDGRLPVGARLPSWRDLAVQLGVARGTVRAAYQRLSDERMIVGRGAAGSHVAAREPAPDLSGQGPGQAPGRPLPPGLFHSWEAAPLPFQPGVPAQDEFPFKAWSRIATASARAAAAAPVGYPDPAGDAGLRGEIASYLGIARGMTCAPSQVIVTNGFAAALNLAIRGLRLEGRTAWAEDPGFPLTRIALGLAGMAVADVPVDEEGLDIDAGLRRAPEAALALVTPGQQAPLGMALSPARRAALLEWAARSDAWIVEDDYLGELQLNGRAAPALASLDGAGRVLHVGSFSKTISPALRLGFLVVPPGQAAHFGQVAACLAPAPAAGAQRAVASFMRGGHFLRHLRRMKQLYAARRTALLATLDLQRELRAGVAPSGGLWVRLDLPDGADDRDIARRAFAAGLAPVPLSPWYASRPARSGLLLGVTNLRESRIESHCRTLAGLLA